MRVVGLPRIPLGMALVLAGMAGLVATTAFAPLSIWASPFVSLFVLLWALDGRTFRSGALIGLVYGFAFWAALISWLTLYLGPIPWLALAITESLYIALAAGFIALILTFGRHRWGRRGWWMYLSPLAVAGAWTAHEWLASNWPWGGFSWARFGTTQYDSPMHNALSWLGTSGLSFIIAWFTISLYQVFTATRVNFRTLLPSAFAVLLTVLIPLFPTTYSDTMNIAGVQGNTKSGLFDVVEPGDNLAAHVEDTLTHVNSPVDLIVWPENAADLDPTQFPSAAAAMNFINTKFDSPILTGTITNPAPDTYFNSSILWRNGVVEAQYDKAHPVPFAEWMPARDFFHFLVPDLVDLVTRSYQFGTRPNVMNIDAHTVGVSICFDIVDDSLIRSMLVRGAQVVIAQTNNADFGTTYESAQQLEIARVRALESGRYVLNVSTVGITALIAPDGTVSESLQPFTRSALQAQDVPLARSTPPGVFTSLAIDILATVIGLGIAALILIDRVRRYRAARANTPIVRRG